MMAASPSALVEPPCRWSSHRSLPTTMGIVAGMLVQNSLKYLLQFGQVCGGCPSLPPPPLSCPDSSSSRLCAFCSRSSFFDDGSSPRPCDGVLNLSRRRWRWQVSHYVGYSALKDFWPKMRLGSNVDCPNGPSPALVLPPWQRRGVLTEPCCRCVLQAAGRVQGERQENADPVHWGGGGRGGCP